MISKNKSRWPRSTDGAPGPMRSLKFESVAGFPAESRFLDGHFPGNPVVPGAMIAAHLSRCLATENMKIARIERMKFVRPLLPGQPFEIDLERKGDTAKVRISDGQGAFAVAQIVLSGS